MHPCRPRLALAMLLASSPALAAKGARGAEVAIVGLHVEGLDGEAALGAAEKLESALERAGLDPVPPGEVRGRLAGREKLVVEGAFLGPGRQELQEGRVLYDRADFEAAVPVLEAAVRSLEAGMAWAADNKALIDALLLLGLAQAGLGEEDAARAAFRRVVVQDTVRELDTVKYSPKIVSLFADERAQVLAQNKGRIAVVAPEGSTITIDGIESLSPNVQLPPGIHYVLVVGEGGGRAFARIDLASGKRATFEPELESPTLAHPGESDPERAAQIDLLYRSLGTHVDTDLVLVAGEAGGREVSVQLYEPRTGNFSKEVSASGGGDPVSAVIDLIPTLGNFVTEQGALRADRVGHQVAPLDISANALLSSMLLDPDPIVETVTVMRGPPWYLWAGVATLAAGGAAGIAIAVSGGGEDTGGGGEEEPPDPNQGVIIVGPF